MKNCFKIYHIKQKRPENGRAVSVVRLDAVHHIRIVKLKRKPLRTRQKIGMEIFFSFTYSKEGPVPEAVIPLRDTLICPEVLPRDQIVEVPAKKQRKSN
jgi:hypothetical protein